MVLEYAMLPLASIVRRILYITCTTRLREKLD
uniref:Uncharacterized protein n=1 Tax=Rhizophora mucronata TaxID=61149 RepID=A0A2P2J7J9_RHIMU